MRCFTAFAQVAPAVALLVRWGTLRTKAVFRAKAFLNPQPGQGKHADFRMEWESAVQFMHCCFALQSNACRLMEELFAALSLTEPQNSWVCVLHSDGQFFHFLQLGIQYHGFSHLIGD